MAEDISIGIGFEVNDKELIKQADKAISALEKSIDKNLKRGRKGQLVPIDENLHKELQTQLGTIEVVKHKYQQMMQLINNTLGTTAEQLRMEDIQRLEVLKQQSDELLKQKMSLTGQLGANTRAVNKAESTGDSAGLQNAINKNLAIRQSLKEVTEAYKKLQEEINIVNANIAGNNYKDEPKTLNDAYEYAGLLTEKLESLQTEINSVSTEITQLESKKILNPAETARLSELTQYLTDLKNELAYTKSEWDKWNIPLNQLEELRSVLSASTSSVIGLDDAVTEEGKAAEESAQQNGEYGESVENAGNKSEKASRNVYLLLRAFNMLNSGINKVRSGIKSLLSKLTQLVKKLITIPKHTNKINKSLGNTGMTFKQLFQNILRYGFGIRSLYFLFNKLRRSVQESLGYIVQISPAVNKSISNITSAFGYMKNSLATMVIPIITAFEKQIVSLCNWIGTLATNIAKLIAALTGQSTIVVATKYWKDYAAGIGSANKQLANFDELNNLTSGSGSGMNAADMFETQDIEPKWKELAEKIKAILKQLWEPVKQAWDKVKDKIYTAWKTLTHNIKLLLSNMFTDFLTVWNQPDTIKIFENILETLYNIMAVVSNLIAQFGRAWEVAGRGQKIFEGIRDIIKVITDGVRTLTGHMAEWALTLDFAPMLEKISGLLQSIKKALEPIMGMITDMWDKFLGPSIKWLIETGLPGLLNIITDIINKVDWAKIRTELGPVWDALKEFTTNVGQGILDFIQQLGDKWAEFMNGDKGEGLSGILTTIADKLKEVSAEDVTNFLKDVWSIVEALAGILKDVAGIILTVANAYKQWHDIDPDNNNLGSLVTKLWDLYKVLTVVGTIVKGIISVLSVANVILRLVPLISKIASIIASVQQALSGLWTTIQTFGPMIGTFLTSFFGAFGPTIVVVIDQFIEWLASKWDWLYDFLHSGETAMDSFAHIGERVSKVWSDFGNTISDVWSDVVDFFTEASNADNFIEVGTNIIAGIVSGIGAAIGTVVLTIHSVVKTISETFCELFGIHSPSTVAAEWGDFIIQGLANGITNALTLITNILNKIKQTFTNSFNTIKTTTLTIVNNLKSGITTAINNIASVTTNVFNRVKSTITNAMTAAKNGVKTALQGMLDFFGKAFSGILDSAKSLLNLLPDGLKTKLGLNNISVGDTNVTVPRLAKGAVIPPNSEFMAVLGDQKHGTNIETPLDTMIEAFNAALAQNGGASNEQMVAMMQTQIQLLQVIAEKEFGITDRQIFKSVRNSAKEFHNSTGKEAFSY